MTNIEVILTSVTERVFIKININWLLEFLVVIVDPDGDNGTMCLYFHLWLARRWQNFISIHYWYSYRKKGYWTLALSSINTKCMSIQLAFSFQYTSGHCPRQGHYPRYTKYKEIKQAKFLLLEELKKEVLNSWQVL